MEVNPCEAVKNNVIGTRIAAEAAAEFGVETFILISTDKAVNPTSLMGATKRAAELVVQALASGAAPRSAIVRFGNVLGSNGSVIPRWQEQIAAGGPVTVTHPDVERYFMLIPEAVQLILQAAAVARGGEIFALEMGEQINLLAMARELIRLSGFVPDEEIQIVFTGLRPGEKLSEELVGPEEEREGAPVDKVLQLRVNEADDPAILLSQVTALGTLAVRGDVPAVIDTLCAIVPTFRPGALLSGQARGRAVMTTRAADRLRARAVRAKANVRTANRPMLLRGLAPKDGKAENSAHRDGMHGAGHRQN
jgi:FlaA1/EpsC-like NDP-sugar epimerase